MGACPNLALAKYELKMQKKTPKSGAKQTRPASQFVSSRYEAALVQEAAIEASKQLLSTTSCSAC